MVCVTPHFLFPGSDLEGKREVRAEEVSSFTFSIVYMYINVLQM